MGFIFRSFGGEEDLWKVFWIYGVLFIVIAKVLAFPLRLFWGIDVDNPTPSQHTQLLVAQNVYLVWLVMSLWRCASSVENRLWGHLTQAFITVSILYVGGIYFSKGTVIDPFKIMDDWVSRIKI